MLYRDSQNNIKRECPCCLHYHYPGHRFCDNCSYEYTEKQKISMKGVKRFNLPRITRITYICRKTNATPKWLTEEQKGSIRKIYKSRKPNEHVDHIIPLRGIGVCGLHVPWNLRTLSAAENMAKSNRY